MARKTYVANGISIERRGNRASHREPLTTHVLIESSIAQDSVGGHTPVTTLRKGLALAKITSGPNAGKYAHFDATATDGRQNSSSVVFLEFDIDLTRYGATEDVEASVIVDGDLYLEELFVGNGFVPSQAKHNFIDGDMDV
jgi:hypothetical protein